MSKESKLSYIKRNLHFIWREYHFLVPPRKLKEYSKLFANRVIFNNEKENSYYSLFNIDDYNNWLVEQDNEKKINTKFKYNPLISIIIPVYNVDPIYLKQTIFSILNQTYKNFEICIADDKSTNQKTLNYLKELDGKYNNIKIVFRNKNGHISAASNSALELAKGEFIALVDDDDVLEENALEEVVKSLNENNKLDLIYTDEDKIDKNGLRCDPHFKPDWSPDTFLSHNYICHLTVIRKKLVEEVGNFRIGYEGSQDYDLFLRITEKTNKIKHIPKVLYHWRMIEGSTSMNTNNKSYAALNGIKALKDAMERRKIKIDKISNIGTSYIIKYKIEKKPKVSIIIPTKDRVRLLSDCIYSILEKTSYDNYEIIIVNNGSVKKETFMFFDKITKLYKYIKVVDDNGDFNFSRLNNNGVSKCTGEYILLLNNDMKIIKKDWLENMLGYAMQEHVGAVGAKLLFKDKRIQHAGVVVGAGEERIANHAYYLKEKYDAALAGRLLVPYNYAAVTGACLMVSKNKFLEVNGLTEKLKVNYNDIDLCLKLLEKGYYNVFLPQVELYHYESVSRGKSMDDAKLEEFNSSKNYMNKKWKKIICRDPFYNDNLSKNMCFVLDKKEKIG